MGQYASYVNKTAMGTGAGTDASGTINGFPITAAGSNGNLVNVSFLIDPDAPYIISFSASPDGNTILITILDGSTTGDIIGSITGGENPDTVVVGNYNASGYVLIGNAKVFKVTNAYVNSSFPPEFLSGGTGGSVNYNS